MATSDGTKGVYRFHWNCGRMGNLDGVFVATDREVGAAIGKCANFGEVLGKHSDISGPIEAGEIVLISADPAVVEVIEKYRLANGYNPLDYIDGEAA